jgi:Tol biopolymer transport system component
MSLEAGHRLGPYEIESLLGAGGMGEVYRARDTRLDRSVALKVLRLASRSEAHARERFEREARIVATFSHPHICAVHDVGHQDGIDYLVMELLDGETLAQRLARGPLAISQALRFASQIADALDHAHRAGIVHRDLKPANIMVSPSGVKLLDFGIARHRIPPVATDDTTLTTPGQVVGTPPYMAPEQLKGQLADARTDLYALGVVLHEMITGRRPFEANSPAELVAAILHSDPPALSSIRPGTPPSLDHVLEKCLAKDADERWQTARDLGDELRWIESGSGASRGWRAPDRKRLRWRGLGRGALVLVAAAGGITVGWLLTRPPRAPDDVVRFTIATPPGLRFSVRNRLAVSPDGRRLAFIAERPIGRTLLWVRDLDATDVRPLPGTEDARNPFWSPDGQSVAFFSEGRLKRVSTGGGAVQTLCAAPQEMGGSWSDQGDVLFATARDGVWRVSAAGGDPVPLTRVDRGAGEVAHVLPYALPGGRHYLFSVIRARPQDDALVFATLGSNERRRLLTGALTAAYAPEGYLLFGRIRTVMAQRFDADTGTFHGEAVPVVDGVDYGVASLFTVGRGVLIYQGRERVTRLTWFDRSGHVLRTVGPPGDYYGPTLSPDNRRVAIERADLGNGNGDLWLIDVDRDAATRLTFDAGRESDPVWSPDGRIAYTSTRSMRATVAEVKASGEGRELLDAGFMTYPTDWSTDGRFLMFAAFSNPSQASILAWQPASTERPRPVVQTSFRATNGRLSPDGRWLAYSSNQSGQEEIYVQDFPAGANRWTISSGGGLQPTWRRDGKELFYGTPDDRLIAVQVRTSPRFETLGVTPLFTMSVPPSPLGVRNSYVVSADGQRFLVVSGDSNAVTARLNVVLNWPALIKG